MKEEIMNEELITPKKASQLLCVSLSSLRNWEKEGKLRCVRTCGGHRRYKLDDVKNILKSLKDDNG